MQTYEFRGSFTFIVQAQDQDAAEELLNEQLGEVLLSWEVDTVSV
jgi:hypothetical protein